MYPWIWNVLETMKQSDPTENKGAPTHTGGELDYQINPLWAPLFSVGSNSRFLQLPMFSMDLIRKQWWIQFKTIITVYFVK